MGMARLGRSRVSRPHWYRQAKLELIDSALFYLPLTSVFYPIIAIPQTLKTVFAPSIELLSRYKDSFTDGTQRLNYKAFKEEMADGGAVKMIEKFDKYLAERTKELKALREKEKEERESKMSKMTKVGDENKE